MKLKKLRLDDFKAVDTQDLLEIKGAIGGYTGCPKCHEENAQNGTPIPRRCNGAAHSPGFWETMNAGWNNMRKLVGPKGLWGAVVSFQAGVTTHVMGSLDDYHSDQPTSMPSRAQIITGCY